MKKILTSIILGAAILSFGLVANASQQATVFHPLTGERKVVEVGDSNAFDGGFILETPTINFDNLPGENIIIPCTVEICGEDSQVLGFSVVSRYRTRLSSSMTSTQSTVPVSSVESFDGTTLTMALLGDKVFLTLEPGTAREEIVKCTALSSTTWSSCTRGLAFTGTAETAVTANQKAHNAGSIVVMSNVHYVYEQLTDTDTDQTISADWTIDGVWDFNYFPTVTGTDLPTTTRQLATKGYVDNVGAGGFTAGNIGDGLTLRANGTAPETMDINTSSPALLSGFIIDEGFFRLNTSTPSQLSAWWLDLKAEDNTFSGLLTANNFETPSSTLSGNVLVTGNTTSTGTAVFEGDTFGVDKKVRSMTCGEDNIVNGSAVYSSATSSRILLADADTATSTVNFIGFALQPCNTEDTAYVQVGGIYASSTANFTINELQYLSGIAGFISETVGTIEGIVGRAISTTEIDMDISKGWQFLESLSDTADVINVKPQARYVRLVTQCTESGGSFVARQTLTLHRVGLTSDAFIDVGDATAGSDSIRCDAAWVGNTITLSVNGDADAVTATAYFYY